MSDQQKITEFSQSAKQGDSDVSADESDGFGWGSFGKPPEDWPISRVEELFDIQKDSADPEELDKDELVRLYSMPAFDDGEEPELTRAGDIGSKKFHVPNQALLFSKLNISKKRFWLVSHSHDEPALCSTEYWPLLPSDGLNLEFYLQYFNSDSFINRPRLSTSSTTNSHQRIKSNLFNKVRLPVPPLPEQRKIATVLYTVDRAIEKTEKVISQAESVLSGVTDELLIEGYGEKELQQNRIYSFEFQMPTDWKVVELQTLNKDSKPICYGIVQPGEYHESGIPILNIEHSRHGDGIDVDELHRVSTQLHEKYSRSKLTGGEIVISVKGSTGDVGRVPSNIGEWNISRDLARISPIEGVNRDWLRFYLSTELAQKFIHVNSPGSTRDSLNIGDLKQLPILLPPQDEQDQIADVVAEIEDKLDSENQYLNRLRRLKRGLMQDLLSGTVRTTDTNIEVPEEIAQYG